MRLLPTAHFVSFSTAVFYRGAGLYAVWGSLAAISAIGAVFFAVARLRFRASISVSRS